MADPYDFERERLAPQWTQEREDHARAEWPDTYLNHLVVAMLLNEYADRLEGDQHQAEEEGSSSGEYFRGIVWGYRNIAAHLRQSDFLPGGELYPGETKYFPQA